MESSLLTIVFIINFIIFFALGMFWYSNKGFRKLWVKENKININNLGKKDILRAFVLIVAFRATQTTTLSCLLNELVDLSLI